MKYEIIYDYRDEYTDERNLREIVECDWDDLRYILASMRKHGCYHILAEVRTMKQEFTIDEIKLLYKALIYLKSDLYQDMLDFTSNCKLHTEDAQRVSKRLQEAKELQLKLAHVISDAEMKSRISFHDE